MAKSTYKGVTRNVTMVKGLRWPEGKPLTQEMKQMERETGKHAVYRGGITGYFEWWKYWRDVDEAQRKPRGFQKGHKPYPKKESPEIVPAKKRARKK